MITTLHIQTGWDGYKTYLKKSFYTPPIKVANITENKTDDPLQLMLMSSSPGILDGDEYRMQIELEKHCSLQLHTQSFQRIFTMKQGASQYLNVQMAAGSSFCFLPHPSVPHKDSCFTVTNEIHMADKCSLIWGEVLTCGRKLNGEVFLFSKYHLLTKVFINSKLVIKENLLIRPIFTDINAIGQWEGFTHQASLIYLNECISAKQHVDFISNYLSKQSAIAFGITAAPVNGLIIRILGQRAEQLYDCLKTIAEGLPRKSNSSVTSPEINPLEQPVMHAD